MKIHALVCGSLLLAGAGLAAGKDPVARAELKNAEGQSVGTATFRQTAKGVAMSVRVRDIKPGIHGIHIHDAGKCDPPDFKTAGGHYNPTASHHGARNPQGMHKGDLQNITVAANGTGSLKETILGVTLDPGAHSLFHEGGTALVLHADPDDMKTDPAGNAGARIACGVIVK